jgi:hypothetical protein
MDRMFRPESDPKIPPQTWRTPMKTRNTNTLAALALSLLPIGSTLADGISVSTQANATIAASAEVLPEPLKADFNQNGSVEIEDLFSYMSVWFTGKKQADFNGDGLVNLTDLMDFINVWLRTYSASTSKPAGK